MLSHLRTTTPQSMCFWVLLRPSETAYVGETAYVQLG